MVYEVCRVLNSVVVELSFLNVEKSFVVII